MLARQASSKLSVCLKEIRQTAGQVPPTFDGVFGIDIWHAVEFSRYGRASFPVLPDEVQGDDSNLLARSIPVKSGRFVRVAP